MHSIVFSYAAGPTGGNRLVTEVMKVLQTKYKKSVHMRNEDWGSGARWNKWYDEWREECEMAHTVVLFCDQEYMDKISGDGKKWCSKEYNYATNHLGSKVIRISHYRNYNATELADLIMSKW